MSWTTFSNTLKVTREHYWKEGLDEEGYPMNGANRRSVADRSTTSDRLLWKILEEKPWTWYADRIYSPAVRELVLGVGSGSLATVIPKLGALACNPASRPEACLFLTAAHLEHGNVYRASLRLWDLWTEVPKCLSEMLRLYCGLFFMGAEDSNVFPCMLSDDIQLALAIYIADVYDIGRFRIQGGEYERLDLGILEDIVKEQWPGKEAMPNGRPTPLANLIIGRAHLELNQPRDAVELLTAAIAEDPDLDEPWFYRSIAYRLLGMTKEAEMDCEHAAAISPELRKGNTDWIASRQDRENELARYREESE